MSGELELGSCISSSPIVIKDGSRRGLKVRSIRKSGTCDYHLVIMSSPVHEFQPIY